ncbi:DNA helicase [Ranunculus cassubicifolius]
MLPSMTSEIVDLLGNKGITNVQKLVDLPNRALHSILDKVSSGSRLYQELQHFPRVQVRFNVQHRDQSHVLNIRLEKMNYRQSSSRAFVPRFPKVKDEGWWLVLGKVATSELVAVKRVSFPDRVNTRMVLPAEPVSLQGMKLMLVSDWLYIVEIYLKFQHVVMNFY